MRVALVGVQHHEVRIYDYVDAEVPTFARMFNKRLQGYRAIGYTVAQPPADMTTPDLALSPPDAGCAVVRPHR